MGCALWAINARLKNHFHLLICTSCAPVASKSGSFGCTSKFDQWLRSVGFSQLRDDGFALRGGDGLRSA
jgi:hypothetical protein